jgi:hypothetical protein
MNTNRLKDITDINIVGYDISDYKNYSDMYLESATWKSTQQELTEDELNDITDNHKDWLIDQIDIGDIIDDLRMCHGIE